MGLVWLQLETTCSVSCEGILVNLVVAPERFCYFFYSYAVIVLRQLVPSYSSLFQCIPQSKQDTHVCTCMHMNNCWGKIKKHSTFRNMLLFLSRFQLQLQYSHIFSNASRAMILQHLFQPGPQYILKSVCKQRFLCQQQLLEILKTRMTIETSTLISPTDYLLISPYCTTHKYHKVWRRLPWITVGLT